MSHYHPGTPDKQVRETLMRQMLNPNRKWGEVTALAQAYGVSRKFLYQLWHKGRAAVQQALEAGKAGRPLNDPQLCKATVILATLIPGSIRKIQDALEAIFGQRPAVGWISETLQKAGRAARRYGLELELPLEVLGEADEIFQGRQPCLTVVDGHSFLVLKLQAVEHRDATSWGCALLDLEKQGVRFRDWVADGGRSFAAGLREAGLAVPLRLDLFHALRDGSKITARLDRRVEVARHTVTRAQQALQEAGQERKRCGPRLKVKGSLAQAQADQAQAEYHQAAWHYLWPEIRQALEPWTPDGEVQDPTQMRATLTAAIALLLELGEASIKKWVSTYLAPQLEALLSAPLALIQALTPWREQMGTPTLRLILWAWQHRAALEISHPETAFAADQVPDVLQIWQLLAGFHRASSLAESFHSYLRPYLQVHKGMPQWLLPLLQLLWNHHVFTRGKRKGQSPMQWAGFQEAPSLAELFVRLLEMPEMSKSANENI